MANHKSAEKRYRQEQKRNLRNRMLRSRLRTGVKGLRKAIAEGDGEAAKSLLPATLSLVDRTAKLGVMHDNAAARTKSRLTKAVLRLAADRN